MLSILRVKATPSRLIYHLQQDGGAGTAFDLSNAQMQSDAAGQPADSPIRKMLDATLADAAEAFGFGMLSEPQDGSDGGVVYLGCVAADEGQQGDWCILATVGEDPPEENSLVYRVTSPAQAGSAILHIEALHTLTR